MEYIYPAFERGRIMKRELLETLRDYSYTGWQIRYRDYPDGILEGCGLKTEENHILISPGIIKCGGFIFLLKNQEKVEYQATEKYIALKFRTEPAEEFSDYSRYPAEFILGEILDRRENEVELCRFKLKAGSRLRYEYRDFDDIQTEYDTMNLANATWSGRGGHTIAKTITDYFAREVLKCQEAEWQDVQFAYQCLQGGEAVPAEILNHYLRKKLRSQTAALREDYYDSNEMYHRLMEILTNIRAGREATGGNVNRPRRMIIMD